MKIGICGLGVIGGAMKRWFEKQEKHEVVAWDEPKGIREDFTGCEVIFICVPAHTKLSGKVDLSIIKSCIRGFIHVGAPFFIRSTVPPGTADALAEEFRADIYSCPEFLTSKTSDSCFEKHDIIAGNRGFLLDKIFEGKKVIVTGQNVEAELAKYAHNCFGALKVHYFNKIYELCGVLGVRYDRVLLAARMTGYIEPTHTQVPGPDGSIGFSGACFPKDMAAMNKILHENGVRTRLISDAINENNLLRSRAGMKREIIDVLSIVDSIREPLGWVLALGIGTLLGFGARGSF